MASRRQRNGHSAPTCICQALSGVGALYWSAGWFCCRRRLGGNKQYSWYNKPKVICTVRRLMAVRFSAKQRSCMTSRFKKSTGPGEPSPQGPFLAMFAVIICGAFGLQFLFNWLTRPPCREIWSSDVPKIERDGKTHAVLDLRKIGRGECVVIKP
jgi:hypothetical protein